MPADPQAANRFRVARNPWQASTNATQTSGFHHHAALCIAAYGFVMAERLIAEKPLGGKKLRHPRAA